MRTPQHNLVGAALQHGLDGPAHALLGFGRRFAVALDQLDESPAGSRDDLDALAVERGRAAEQVAVETALGGQHPHHPAAGGQTGGLDGRLHTDNGHGSVFPAQEVDGGGRSGIAGDDHELAPPGDQRSDRLVSEPDNLLARPRPVGAVLTVAQVEERFAGQRTPHLAPDGQTAQPRIVDGYGSAIHN